MKDAVREPVSVTGRMRRLAVGRSVELAERCDTAAEPRCRLGLREAGWRERLIYGVPSGDVLITDLSGKDTSVSVIAEAPGAGSIVGDSKDG